jgi:fibronectin type 3 domain-containing protein
MTYWDSQVQEEGKYTYKITAYTAHGVHSEESNAAAVMWWTPPQPPYHLEAIPGDRTILLAWETPSGPKTGRGALSFNVYRRDPDGAYGVTPVNGSPIKGKTYRDLGVTNGRTYHYVVRALESREGKTIESMDSTEVTAVALDLTPPAAPSVTMAFQAQDGIVIIWEPSPDSNLEGYRVYRRLETEHEPKLISPRLELKTMYVDDTFAPGLTYYYSVTAVDASMGQNESDFSRELKVITVTHKGE